jgi:hypothetical protein
MVLKTFANKEPEKWLHTNQGILMHQPANKQITKFRMLTSDPLRRNFRPESGKSSGSAEQPEARRVGGARAVLPGPVPRNGGQGDHFIHLLHSGRKIFRTNLYRDIWTKFNP